MLRDDQALYAEILTNPRDNAPRLIYADCVEEAGAAEFAAFIRFQCEHPDIAFYRTGGVTVLDISACPEDRHQELAAAARPFQRWFHHHSLDVLGPPRFLGHRYFWRRGFLTEIHGADVNWAFINLGMWRRKFPVELCLVIETLEHEYFEFLYQRYLALGRDGRRMTVYDKMSRYTGVRVDAMAMHNRARNQLRDARGRFARPPLAVDSFRTIEQLRLLAMFGNAERQNRPEPARG